MVQYDMESNITNEPNLVCSFSEQLNTANCLKIQDELLNKVQESKVPVIFDMQDVDYVSSVFLGMCLKVGKEVGFDNFTVVNVHPNVKKVFKIAGFDKQISIT